MSFQVRKSLTRTIDLGDLGDFVAHGRPVPGIVGLEFMEQVQSAEMDEGNFDAHKMREILEECAGLLADHVDSVEQIIDFEWPEDFDERVEALLEWPVQALMAFALQWATGGSGKSEE